ncbi:mastermind-like domain-containing protein 1 [Frankliniella occidentalis]|uniref:Mastermind-like domain-containing protein 1 n=1 Tax=Frankliniella occidentalis TaxID=133901 RepID=A0A6J1S0D8_FRAOC|nr:mastermind-like domain-containing protein 1 [Frankliniella occidentalis]
MRTGAHKAWCSRWGALVLAAALLSAVLADPTPEPSPAPSPAAPPTTSTTTTTTTTTTNTAAASSTAASPSVSDEPGPPRSTRSDAAVAADPLLEAAGEDDGEEGGPNQKREDRNKDERGQDRDMERGQDRDDQATREQHQVAILKQINRVNEDGSYTFGYEAADGSFKIETRDVLGHVKGMFGFIDEKGQLKRVSYTAANGTGFQADPTPPAAPAAPQQVPGAVYQQVIRPTARRRPSAVRLVVAPPTSTAPPEARGDPVIQQIPRRHNGLSSTALPATSTSSPSLSSTRAPGRHVLVLATPAPGADGSTPTPAPYGQFVRRTEPRRPVLVLGSPTTAASTSTTSTTAAPVTEDSASGEAADGSRDREGNELRRQLPLPPLPPLGPLSALAADRDVDPLGLSGLSPGAGQLLRLLSAPGGPAPLGRGDTGDVYGGGGSNAASGAVPHGLHALGTAPHYSGVLRQGPRALQQQLLQQHILADLDLTPRPRPPQEYDDYYGGASPLPLPPPGAGAGHLPAAGAAPLEPGQQPPTRAPAGPLPPLQLEPAVAMALEQFLISRGIRLRPYRPYAPPPYMMRYRPPYAPPPYYDDDPYGYDPYLVQRHPYHMYHRGYPYDPYAYQQPYPYPQYSPYQQQQHHQQQLQQQQHHHQQQQQQQGLFVPVRPPLSAYRRAHQPVQDEVVQQHQQQQYDPRQELLIRMLINRMQQQQQLQQQQQVRQVSRGGGPQLQQAQLYDQQAQLYDQQLQQALPTSIVSSTTQAPPSTSARVRSVKILEPDAEGSELSPTTVKPPVGGVQP